MSPCKQPQIDWPLDLQLFLHTILEMSGYSCAEIPLSIVTTVHGVVDTAVERIVSFLFGLGEISKGVVRRVGFTKLEAVAALFRVFVKTLLLRHYYA